MVEAELSAERSAKRSHAETWNILMALGNKQSPQVQSQVTPASYKAPPSTIKSQYYYGSTPMRTGHKLRACILMQLNQLVLQSGGEVPSAIAETSRMEARAWGSACSMLIFVGHPSEEELYIPKPGMRTTSRLASSYVPLWRGAILGILTLATGGLFSSISCRGDGYHLRIHGSYWYGRLRWGDVGDSLVGWAI
jgi:hypothetical protein